MLLEEKQDSFLFHVVSQTLKHILMFILKCLIPGTNHKPTTKLSAKSAVCSSCLTEVLIAVLVGMFEAKWMKDQWGHQLTSKALGQPVCLVTNNRRSSPPSCQEVENWENSNNKQNKQKKKCGKQKVKPNSGAEENQPRVSNRAKGSLHNGQPSFRALSS